MKQTREERRWEKAGFSPDLAAALCASGFSIKEAHCLRPSERQAIFDRYYGSDKS